MRHKECTCISILTGVKCEVDALISYKLMMKVQVKYTKPANPVRNFCRQKLAAPPSCPCGWLGIFWWTDVQKAMLVSQLCICTVVCSAGNSIAHKCSRMFAISLCPMIRTNAMCICVPTSHHHYWWHGTSWSHGFVYLPVCFCDDSGSHVKCRKVLTSYIKLLHLLCSCQQMSALYHISVTCWNFKCWTRPRTSKRTYTNLNLIKQTTYFFLWWTTAGP